MFDSSHKMAVIGLGNTLRRDDGVGIHVLAGLQDELKDYKVSFLNFGIASFGLVNFLSGFKKVLLIDAMDAGLAPATMKIFRLKDATVYVKDNKLSSHEISLADLLEVSRTLGLETDIQVAGVQVKDASYGLEMSPELEAAKDHIVEDIKHFVLSWLEERQADNG
ncbi:MAG: hydrogenase maturation protease [Candidatus Omnitrophica bacterium]|nr:hydrogenase maturation protease [Candidatus Omnitrophota bacterium]MDD5574413.1 hydrogenase maturation protease [Candidatus Omnitrophota bacterium]